MEPEKQLASLREIRQSVLQDIKEDLKSALSTSRGEHGLVALRQHADFLLSQIAKIKTLETSSLATGDLTAQVMRQKGSSLEILQNMKTVADAMFYLNEDIRQCNVPQFEIMTGFHLLVKGHLDFLPAVIDELATPKLLPESLSSSTMSSISNEILSLLDQIDLMFGVELVDVTGGVATFASRNEFETKVTLTQAPSRLLSPPEEKDSDQTSSPEIPSFILKIPDVNFDKSRQYPKRWWWSVQTIKFFPSDSEGFPLLEDFQVEYLRREFDGKMISMASKILATDPPAGGELGDDQIKPLELLFDFCRDTSNRAVLTVVRASMTEIVSSPLFDQSCRLGYSQNLKPGYRLRYWEGVPVLGQQPWLEIGVDTRGVIGCRRHNSLETEFLLSKVDNFGTVDHLTDLIQQGAQELAETIMSQLLSDLKSLAEGQPQTEISFASVNQSTPGGREICCFRGCEEVMKVGMELRKGRLKLEVSSADPRFRQKSNELEDKVNRVWMNAGKTKAAVGVDPHKLALRQVSKVVFEIAQGVRLRWRQPADIKTTVLCRRHGVGLPTSIRPSMLEYRTVVSLLRGFGVNLEDLKMSLVVGEIQFAKIGGRKSQSTDPQMDFELVLILASGDKAFLSVGTSKQRTMEFQIFNLLPVPNNVSRRLSRGSKKRKIREHDMADQDSGQVEVADQLESFVNTQVISWCREQGLLESLKQHLKSLHVGFEEEFLVANKEIRPRIRIFKTDLRHNFEGAGLGVEEVVVDAVDSSRWTVQISSSRSSVLCLQKRRPTRQKLHGNILLGESQARLAYSKTQSIYCLMQDLALISANQVFLESLCHHLQRSSGNEYIVMEKAKEELTATFVSVAGAGAEDSWRMEYRVEWVHRETQIVEELDVKAPPNGSHYGKEGPRAVPSEGRKRHKANPTAALAALSVPPPDFPEDSFRNGKHESDLRVGCRVTANVAIPEFIVKALEDVLDRGECQFFFSALRLVSSTLYHLQNLWDGKDSPWRFFALPHSRPLEWSFICVRNEAEKKLDMKFVSAGFLFARIKGMNRVQSFKLNEAKTLAARIVSMLEMSLNT